MRITSLAVIGAITAPHVHAAAPYPQVVYTSNVIDEAAGGPISEAAFEALQDAPFKHFVQTVSAHARTLLATEADCRENPHAVRSVALTFVRQPVLATPLTRNSTAFTDARRPPDAKIILQSPWIKLTATPMPDAALHAIFLWSERRILADQAILAGAAIAHSDMLTPIEPASFNAFAQDYADTVLQAASPEAEQQALAAIQTRVPADLVWLFRQAWQSTRGPFTGFARDALPEIMARAQPGYSQLATTLLDRSQTTIGRHQRYDSILDVGDIKLLEKYRIKSIR